MDMNNIKKQQIVFRQKERKHWKDMEGEGIFDDIKKG